MTKCIDLSYSEKFSYSVSDNPYNQKLDLYSDFVMKDHESELHSGKWNEIVFKKTAPISVEVGCGNGSFMIDYSQAHPGINFVGLDFRFKRSFKLAQKLQTLSEKNFRYLRAKGERLHHIFADSEVDQLFLFFPDPWPKKRHNKKRLLQKPFLEIAHKILKPDGYFFIKTDHDGYAEWMEEAINACPLFKVELKSADLHQEYPDHFLSSFTTGFEKIFLKQNIKIKAFVLKSIKGAG